MKKNKFGKATFYNDGSKYTCKIDYKDHVFIGETTCYPEDEKYKTERTGYNIAECRAEVQRLRFLRDVVNAELRAMKRLRSTAHIVKGSNVEKHLNEEIITLTEKVGLIDETIQDIRDGIKCYIEDKDKVYRLYESYPGKEE